MLFQKRAGTTPLLLPPKPLVLSPSGNFDGVDGKWSTFIINVAGDGKGQGQNFKVLISTALPTTLIPAQSEWCNEQCSKQRGIVANNALGFDYTTSRWNGAGNYGLPFKNLYWWSRDLLSPSNNNSFDGEWGQTTVGLGGASKQSITIDHQFVATSIWEEFFLGYLGLSVGVTSLAGADRPTFLSGLAQAKDTVSSASYGFTAGASYRNNGVGVTGNMVFGGYDRARLVQGNSVSIPMPNKQNNTLLVGVQSITYNANPDVEPGSASFTSGGFNAIIDSTLPYLILPKDICDKFVQKFNLDYDSTNNLYTINNTAHERNTQQNATVSFKIGYGSANSATYSTIKFPYEAFYLDASSPFTQNAKKYFPIRKSTNGLHILGRTFLQEAYIYVDYERANFTVAQAFFSDPMPNEDLVSIYDTTYERPPRSSSDPEDSGLSSGTIAGIVIGIVAVFLIIGACAFFYYRRRRNSKVKALEQEEKPPGVDTIDTIAAGSEIKHRRVSELTGSELPYSAQPKPVGYYGGDHKSIPELSPHSPPSELYSPPLEDENGSDYFTGPKPRRRGATRDSSGNNTPGTPVAELAGDDACYQVSGEQPNAIVTLQRPNHNRGPSDNSLSTNIDEVLAGPDKDTAQVERKHSSRFVEHTDDVGLSRAEMVVSPLENTRHDECDVSTEPTTLRRPSHTRGLSDTTVNSESTAVSQPTPEELLRWAGNSDAIRPD